MAPFDPLKGAVALCAVEVGDALVVGIADELVKAFLAQAHVGRCRCCCRCRNQGGSV